MTLFTLTSHVNGDFATLTATRRGRQVVVVTPTGTSLARNVHQAGKLAAEALGPALERAGKTSSEWGLHVSVGDVAAKFGRFPEGPASPQLTGPPAKPSQPIAQIYNGWCQQELKSAPLSGTEKCTSW